MVSTAYSSIRRASTSRSSTGSRTAIAPARPGCCAGISTWCASRRSASSPLAAGWSPTSTSDGVRRDGFPDRAHSRRARGDGSDRRSVRARLARGRNGQSPGRRVEPRPRDPRHARRADDRAHRGARRLCGQPRRRRDPVHLLGVRRRDRCGARGGAHPGAQAQRGDARGRARCRPADRDRRDVRADAALDDR